MPARNQLGDLVTQLQQIESILLEGATRSAIAEQLGLSPRQVSRHFDTLTKLGLKIELKPVSSSREEPIRVARKKTRRFAEW
jgi:DNA-binding transcriptional ArsR family regulator